MIQLELTKNQTQNSTLNESFSEYRKQVTTTYHATTPPTKAKSGSQRF